MMKKESNPSLQLEYLKKYTNIDDSPSSRKKKKENKKKIFRTNLQVIDDDNIDHVVPRSSPLFHNLQNPLLSAKSSYRVLQPSKNGHAYKYDIYGENMQYKECDQVETDEEEKSNTVSAPNLDLIYDNNESDDDYIDAPVVIDEDSGRSIPLTPHQKKLLKNLERSNEERENSESSRNRDNDISGSSGNNSVADIGGVSRDLSPPRNPNTTKYIKYEESPNDDGSSYGKYVKQKLVGDNKSSPTLRRYECTRAHDDEHMRDLSPPRKLNRDSEVDHHISSSNNNCTKGFENCDEDGGANNENDIFIIDRKGKNAPVINCSKRSEDEHDISPPRTSCRKESNCISTQDRIMKEQREASTQLKNQDHKNKFDKMNNQSTEIVYRDKEGRKITEEKWLEMQNIGKVNKRKRVSVELAWGGGLVQTKERENRLKEETKIISQPFIRHEVDEDYDEELKRRKLWDDPMNFIPSTHDNKTKNDTEVVDTNKVMRPKCLHIAPPNRFGILAGYRWDGVVRGNGYEEKRMKLINKKKNEKRIAYLMNVADM